MRSILLRAGLTVSLVTFAACGGSEQPTAPAATPTTAAKPPVAAVTTTTLEEEYELDDRCIGDGTPGPITRRLQDLFFAVVRGREERYRSWLAYL